MSDIAQDIQISPFSTNDTVCRVVVDNNSQTFVWDNCMNETTYWTLNFWIRSTANHDATLTMSDATPTNITVTTTWQRVVATVHLSNINDNCIYIDLPVGTYYFYNSKLEKGNRYSDYSTGDDDFKIEIATVQGIADGKSTCYYSDIEPTGTFKKNDTWFNGAQDNAVYTWDGSAWVKKSIGANALSAMITTAIQTANVNALQGISDAATALSVAQQAENNSQTAITSANGKNTVCRSATQPTGTFKNNDVWFDTAHDNAIYIYNGTWVANKLGANAIAELSITNALIANATISSAKISSVDAGTITAGLLSADRIGAGTIAASKLIANTITAASGVIANATIQTAMIADLAVSGAKIADATITNAKIANLDAGKITTGTLLAGVIGAGTISAEKLSTGAVTADKVATNAISTDKLAVGLEPNLYTTGYDTFEQITANTIGTVSNSNICSAELSTIKAFYGTRCVKLINPSTELETGIYFNKTYNNGTIKVLQGVQYIVSCYLRTDTGASVEAYLEARYGNTSVVYSDSETSSTAVIEEQWQRVSFKTIATQDYLSIYVALTSQGNLYIDAIQVETDVTQTKTVSPFKPAGATIINGGNITTGTITAAQLAAKTITANEIAANAITAEKVSINDLSAISANLGTITAGILQSTNYEEGLSGSKWDFNLGTFNSRYTTLDALGKFVTTSGNIGGFIIGERELYTSKDSTHGIGLVSTTGGVCSIANLAMWVGSDTANIGTAPLQIYNSGKMQLRSKDLSDAPIISTYYLDGVEKMHALYAADGVGISDSSYENTSYYGLLGFSTTGQGYCEKGIGFGTGGIQGIQYGSFIITGEVAGGWTTKRINFPYTFINSNVPMVILQQTGANSSENLRITARDNSGFSVQLYGCNGFATSYDYIAVGIRNI